MRVMIVALALLAGCGPSRMQVEIDEILARHTARAERISARLPLYREMCRAQMPTVSDAAADLCARDRGIAELREIERQGLAEIDAVSGTRRMRPSPTPPGSGFNPIFVAPAVR